MRIRSVVASALVALVVAAPLAAQQKPIQLALFTPVQIVPESQGVGALRLNLIYSVNRSVQYVDLGLVNVTTGGASRGVQWAFVSINRGSFSGWQHSFAAVTQGRFTGLQSGAFTAAADGEGLQWSVVNTSQHWNGLQLGLVNYARTLKGVQIGLINIIRQGGQFPVFPIVNWSK